jgi:hypothetical protein
MNATLNIVTPTPNTDTAKAICPVLELSAEQVPLWLERARWNAQLNEATRNLARIDRALALPRYEGKAQTVLVRGPVPVETVKRGRKVVSWVVKRLGQIAVHFRAPYQVGACWVNVKSVDE